MKRKKKRCIDCKKLKYIFSNKRCTTCAKLRVMTVIAEFNLNDVEGYTTSELIAVADHFLRQFLLKNKKPTLSGKILCPLTNKFYLASGLHVCHYIDRDNYKLRWDLRNVLLASANSNTFESTITIGHKRSLHHKRFAETLSEDDLLYLHLPTHKYFKLTRAFIVKKIKQFYGNR